MAAAENVNASQAMVLGIIDGGLLDVSQVQVYAAAIWPAPDLKASQAQVLGVKEGPKQLNVSQVQILAAVRGRVFDPTIRAWTFTLDGHDFYGLRLGNEETLLYDLYSEQWYIWADGDDNLWRVFDITNWFGGTSLGANYGSAVVAGGDSNGAIYFLDPDSDEDDSAVQGSDDKKPFKREVTGQVLTKGYSLSRCFGVILSGSIGQLDEGIPTEVSLKYSDDRGTTYVQAEDISVNPNDIEARVFWRSLGSFRQPGRLFRITDYGALKRIDALDMMDEPGGNGG